MDSTPFSPAVEAELQQFKAAVEEDLRRRQDQIFALGHPGCCPDAASASALAFQAAQTSEHITRQCRQLAEQISRIAGDIATADAKCETAMANAVNSFAIVATVCISALLRKAFAFGQSDSQPYYAQNYEVLRHTEDASISCKELSCKVCTAVIRELREQSGAA